jgi:hypothetical protein
MDYSKNKVDTQFGANKTIYFVTSIGLSKEQKEQVEIDAKKPRRERKLFSPRNVRTWGWYPKEEYAREAAENNVGEMHEAGYYQYICLEKCQAGIYPIMDVIQWYKWKRLKRHGKWVECKKPTWAEGIVNWAIG